jgi:hypothetical protein
MNLLVCGGRDYQDAERLYKVLDSIATSDVHLIHGAAKGADSLADAWARERGYKISSFPANWGAYGKAAGHYRNTQMIEEGEPDIVVAFPGGAGTANMIKQAKACGIVVVRVE